jgi:hypothetical protein
MVSSGIKRGIQMKRKTRNNFALASATLFALLLMPSITAAQDYPAVQDNGNLHLRGYGSFFLPGTQHAIDAATARGGDTRQAGVPGLSMINQMYVQFMKPQAQNGKEHYPIAMVHGCCLSVKSWQTTPDGRMGWDEYFVREGFDTYLIDQVARARSGFDATAYNKVRTGALTPDKQQPILIPTDQYAWRTFRWGVTPCTASPCSETTAPHPDIRFPMNTVGVGPGSNLQFYNQIIPDLNGTLTDQSVCIGTGSSCVPTDPAAFYNTPAQMALLAKELGGAILMGHSESSPFPTMAAFRPDAGCYPFTTAAACKIKGIIQIETGCFGNLTGPEITTLSHIPILIVSGDYTSVQPSASCQTEIQQITGAGGDIKYARLPSLTPGSLYPGSPGPIFGNDHMMMLDNNNLEIADILIGWATSRGL